MMQKVYLPELNDQIKKLSDEIKVLLKNKLDIEKLLMESKNSISLGGVRFWFQIKESNNQKMIYFLYDQSPMEWNIDRIKNDLYTMQDYYYKKYNIIF